MPPWETSVKDEEGRLNADPMQESASPEPEDVLLDEPVEDLDSPPRVIYPGEIDPDRIDADAVKVIRRLVRHGYQAYLVGGGVRDLLLGNKPKDFDIATDARPNEVRRLFRNCRIIGRRFRLAHILFAGGKIIEVATFRRDPSQERALALYGEREDERELAETNGDFSDAGSEDEDLLIRSDNTFGEPHEDAIRRDFTLNGLFYDLERGEIIDYIGGVPDLRRRTLRMIGDPDVRVREDPIRILRAIKFSARLDLGIDPSLYETMLALRGEIRRAARPRVLEELLRLMRGGAAQRSIYLAWDSGVLAVILPEVAAYLDDASPGSDLTWRRLSAIDRRLREGRLPSDAVLLASLLWEPMQEYLQGSPAPGDAFEEFMVDLVLRLNLPRRMKDRIRCIVASQRRMRAGKIRGLTKRDFFDDALTLFTLDCEARLEDIPSWARMPANTAAAHESTRDEGPRRPRRRRRAPFGNGQRRSANRG